MRTHRPVRDQQGFSRRRFLRGVGLGAGAAVVGGPAALVGAGAAEASLDKHPGHAAHGRAQSPLNFGRIFTKLPPFAEATDAVKAALAEIGKPGGLMDAKDDLAAGPLALINDPALNTVNKNNPTHTAGTHFVGQFLDHDVTFDATSPLGVPTDPTKVRNTRVPTLDLDSVYGGGPANSPQLYDPSDPAKLSIESGGAFEDVPRNPDGRAIIADPRNDENLVISGLQAAFILFHNRLVDLVRENQLAPPPRNVTQVFQTARDQTRWHYHSMVLNQFLPQILGSDLLASILTGGNRFYRPASGQAFMPVEFQTGSYRMGHSMVRPSYRVNFTSNGGKPFFAFVFDPSIAEGTPNPDDMRGGSRAARRFIGWPTFFDFGDGNVKPNKLIDTILSTPLFQLPLFTIASGEPPTSLAQRNLLRHLTWSLPSGQSLASTIGVPALSKSELAETGIGDVYKPFLSSTPMWFYVLHEAYVRAGGEHLGPVGGRIVGEVIVGLLKADPDSLLNQTEWRPLIPMRASGKVSMQDILDFAGVSGVR
jgi:Animal haem peroxidase